MKLDLENVASAIAEIAEEEIASRFGRLAERDIGTKSGPNDFVTEADRAAETRLEKALKGFCPEAIFIGEESVSGDPSLLSKLGKDGSFWIVDPLDGTRNFVQGREEFGTIVAFISGGETCAGWIYAIPEKAFAMAEAGGGASWRGKKLKSFTPHDRSLYGYRAIGNMAEPWKSMLIPRLKEMLKTEPVHCSAYGYIKMVRGARDFGLYSRVHPWDHAAGVLMLNEIGGRAEYLDNGAPYAPVPEQGRPLLVSGSNDIWRRAHDVLLPPKKP